MLQKLLYMLNYFFQLQRTAQGNRSSKDILVLKVNVKIKKVFSIFRAILFEIVRGLNGKQNKNVGEA